ncbi:YnfA family protein [Leptospira kmetyi]|uniref:YnfA family protein n=1 Tax=Leptospira kmetyi TaxID=408139 RepID=UPI00108252C7|nr:YnfA family protein [Leptospira kmetyi]
MILKTVFIFVLAGLCEIGGGYLVWLWLKEGKSFWFGLTGFLILGLYGIVATLQPANFARTYATYGGVFIAMSLFWSWKFDGYIPDKFDLLGAGIALIGVCIIYYSPR